MSRGLMLASALVVSALAPACTTPYRIDVGSAPGDGGALDGGGRDTSLPFDGGPDSPDTPDAFTCSPSCIDAMRLSPCAGEDPIDCPLGCLDGPTAHCGEMVVANVEEALAAAAVNGAVVATDTVIDTTGCMWPSLLAPINGQIVDVVGGVRVCLFVVASLSIPGGAELRAVGAHPLVIVSEGEVQIIGDLSVDSRRAGTLASTETLGAGSGSGGAIGMPGMGSGSGAGGGGGGGFATNGGRGGNAMSGIGFGGEGGLGAGYLLEPLVGGARGGAGGTSGGMTAAVGGPGGGAMQITSRTRIVSMGYLGASGGGGARGTTMSSGGAGGGSGGAILLEAPEIVFLTGDVNVSGGGGGSGSCSFGNGLAGNDGANQSGAPSGGDPCPLGGGAGGRGAGGTTPEGTDAGNGSGGGGGAGVVRIHVRTPLILPGGARLNPRTSSGLGVYTVDPLVIR